MTLTQSNAILTSVADQARTDEWRGSESGADVSVWTGSAPAYYQEKRERAASGGAESFLVRRSLIVEEGQPAVAYQSEQVVTFTFAGASQSGVVRDIERRVLDGMGSAQSTRLTIEPV